MTATAEHFGRRVAAGQDLVAGAGAIAAAALAMAQRFHQGGKLIVFGTGGAATDAQHVAVEFVHPVIVGKRALPAICLTCDAATITGIAAREGLEAIFAHQIRYLAEPDDIAVGIWVDGPSPSVLTGLAAARERGLLTIGLGGGGRAGRSAAAEHVLTAATDDPRIAKEMLVTTYHLLWELVHVFFEQPGVLGPRVVT
ncbi:MAG TPA: SIS domain-containing protein [Streptosporangiaceae bacterium]